MIAEVLATFIDYCKNDDYYDANKWYDFLSSLSRRPILYPEEWWWTKCYLPSHWLNTSQITRDPSDQAVGYEITFRGVEKNLLGCINYIYI